MAVVVVRELGGRGRARARRVAMAIAAVVLALSVTACEPVRPAVAYDFDGDGRADFAWIDGTGSWRTLRDPGALVWAYAGRGDSYVPGDYDGDGRTEPAIIDAGGHWVTSGAAGAIEHPRPDWPDGVPHAGGNFMLPVPGRYQGGARDIPAWYRDIDGTWFIEGQDPIQFGNGPASPGTLDVVDAVDQDLPVPADYDGDGITDLAVYSPRTGSYRIRSSIDGSVSDRTLLATSGSDSFILPVPADYDGVGHAQAAVWGARTGWVIDGRAQIDPFGSDPTGRGPSAFAMPVPADYDGDGRTDLAVVWDNGDWKVQTSWAYVSIAPVWSSGNLPVAFPVTLLWDVARFTLVGRCVSTLHSC